MQNSKNTKNITLAHDWLVSMRGGEWVLDRLAQLYGPTKIYTLVKNNKPLTKNIDQSEVITSPLQFFPGASTFLRRHYLPLMPWAVSKLKIENCDLILSTSSAVIKAIKIPNNIPHICYCHSPARYLWDMTEAYTGGAGGFTRKIGLNVIKRYFQKWDRETAKRVTLFIANSNFTAERIKSFYERDSIVIYPPVRTSFFTINPEIPRENWFLVVSALEPYKMTDLIIEMANQKNIQVKIAGTGSQFQKLKKKCGPTVEMLGRVSEENLLDLYRRAKALLFPQTEDFGLTPVEAQSTGCPVIAFAQGGALETITKQTGVFFDENTVTSILKAINQFNNTNFNPDDCRENASRFNEPSFDEKINKVIQQYLIS